MPIGRNKRDAFLQRISTVGGGVREAIQMGLGSIVYDVRDMVARGVYDEEEMDLVVAFHDQTEEFWRRTMATTPPMDAALMVAGLKRLHDKCTGPLAGFSVRLEQAIEKAQVLAVRKHD